MEIERSGKELCGLMERAVQILAFLCGYNVCQMTLGRVSIYSVSSGLGLGGLRSTSFPVSSL